MRNWDQYYTARVLAADRRDYLVQVGHTVGGKPIADAEFEAMCDQIISALDLNQADVLLDLCCGNGLFTRRLADRVAWVVGVDSCAPLLEIAEADHGAENVEYHLLDARDVERLAESFSGRFTKVLIYGALQNFAPRVFEGVFEQILPLTSPGVRMFFGFVPDRTRKWRFYNTPRRRAEHILRHLAGTDNFGVWWDKGDIERLCGHHGLACSFPQLPDGLRASTYRFNALIGGSDGRAETAA